jgi:hypothetical protein
VKELEESLRYDQYKKERFISPMELRIQKFGHYLSDKGKELCIIMKSLLQLNPFLRMTAYECLTNYKVFDNVRKP